VPPRALRQRLKERQDDLAPLQSRATDDTAEFPVLRPESFDEAGTAAFAVQPAARLDHLGAAVLAAAVTALLVLASTAGLAAMIGAVAVLQAVLIAGWLLALDQPGVRGAAVIAAASAAAADALLAARDRPSLAALLGVYGLAFVALIVHQLLRGPVRERVASAMAGVAALVILLGALGSFVVIRRGTDGDELVVAAVLAIGVALVVGHLVDLVVPVPRFADGCRGGCRRCWSARPPVRSRRYGGCTTSPG